MGFSITVRDIDPGDKSWLKREARQVGVSTEERTTTECRSTPSEAFARHFGAEHGFGLPSPSRYGYRPMSFSGEGAT